MTDGGTEEVKAAPNVNGEELELMLQEWDTPLVIDAYATWYVSDRAVSFRSPRNCEDPSIGKHNEMKVKGNLGGVKEKKQS